MKKILVVTLFIIILGSFFYFLAAQEKQYRFIKDYKTTITVGGVVGIRDIIYHTGDVVKGKKTTGGIKIRIAPFNLINLGKPSSASYTEFITVPTKYLK